MLLARPSCYMAAFRHLPGRVKDRPDQDPLAQHLERFKALA
jgi:hypothetical protein